MASSEGGRLQGRTAVVTGAGSGIGQATVIRFASEGAHVLAADLNGDAAAQTADAAGHGTVSTEVDVREEASVIAMFDAAGRLLGTRLDVLANIAGIGSTTNAVDTPLDVWEDVFAVNVTGTFLCCKHALPRMIEAGSGSIVNMASVAGLVGLRNRAAYCGSKGAVVAFTRAVAIDHMTQGIRINCVCPGTVDSPWVRRLVEQSGESIDGLIARQPMGRLGTPNEIAGAILYLASDEAAFVTGSTFVIDGGLTAI